MRLRINGKFWLVIGILGGIAATAVIILATLTGGRDTNVATVNDIIGNDEVTTDTVQDDETAGIGVVAGLAAGADKAEKEQEPETEKETEETTEPETYETTQATTWVQTEAQTQPVTQPQTEPSTPAQTEATTQPPATTESDSNVEKFRGKEGAGDVDIDGPVKDYDSYVNNAIKNNEAEQPATEMEAMGSGYVEF